MLSPPRSKSTLSALLLAVVVLGAVPFVARPSKAAAHPLGNFTINRYSRVELAPDTIRVRYVLDMAEIPTFQERDSIDKDGDGTLSEAEKSRYLQGKVEAMRNELELKLDGATVDLETVGSNLSFPPGQGGLDTQRIEIDFSAPVRRAATTHSIAYKDNNFSDRIGWREVIVRGLKGVRLTNANAPAQDVSDELRAYPKNGLTNPLHVDNASASFDIAPGAPGSISAPEPSESAQAATHARAVRGNPDSTLGRYANLIAKDRLSVGIIILALLAAVGFGALHALSPGHGKTIVAAYLVGSKGTWRHALLLALTVTATHTSSVYALGFITLYLSQFIVPERLYPWLGIASGALIVAMGLMLFVTRLRASGAIRAAFSWLRVQLPAGNRGPQLALASEAGALVVAPEHRHDETADHIHTDGGHSSTAHSHGFGPAHQHAMPGQDDEPVSWRSLIGLGIFGGLLPCPSAIVVMLSAIALHRVAFGMVLILAFSCGLAGVLTGIGFALVYARAIPKRLPLIGKIQSRFPSTGGVASLALRLFPVGSAMAVFAAGGVVLLRALAQQGAI